MMPIGPNAGYGRPEGPRRGPIVALSIATLVIVPWVVIDNVRGGDEPAPSTTTLTTQASTSTTSTTTTTPEGEDETFPQVALAASWQPRGTSRYSETDEQTQSRIRRQKLGQSTAAPTSTTIPGDVSDTTVPTKDLDPDGETTTTAPAKTNVSAPPSTKAPQSRPTQPAPTQPAPTQPAPTQPAPTQPAPTQPAPTQPPAPQPPEDAAPAALVTT